jgi:hypothetical protein
MEKTNVTEKKIENLEIKSKIHIKIVNNLKLGFAKDILKDDPWCFIKLSLVRKRDNTELEKKSKILKLEENTFDVYNVSFLL